MGNKKDCKELDFGGLSHIGRIFPYHLVLDDILSHLVHIGKLSPMMFSPINTAFERFYYGELPEEEFEDFIEKLGCPEIKLLLGRWGNDGK
jgi:hypothetical protein